MYKAQPRHFSALLLVAATLALAPKAAHAFGTINSMGQAAEHEKITRIALRVMGFHPNSLNEIAGQPGTWGAVGAPDYPARNLITSYEAHCDNGDYMNIAGYPHSPHDAERSLTNCQTWVFSKAILYLTNHAPQMVDTSA